LDSHPYISLGPFGGAAVNRQKGRTQPEMRKIGTSGSHSRPLRRAVVITVGPDATDASTVGTWDIEASSISLMVSEGWNRETFKPGDPITVVAHPSRNGSNEVLLFYAVKADGTRLYRAQHRYPTEAE
jgi:hypothetical protein